MEWGFVHKVWDKWASNNISSSSGNFNPTNHNYYVLCFGFGFIFVKIKGGFIFVKIKEIFAIIASFFAGEPLKAALLINYDPTGPSRLLSTM